MAPGGTRPSDAIERTAWAQAHDELVELLRELIRIPSVNPPEPPGDGELRAARFIHERLAGEGLRPELVEPFPGRGSVAVRLRGDGTGGGPLLLLSHLDVVPVVADEWTHDPFGGEIDAGYVWGRGAVDMKGMVAMEIAVLLALAREARAAGRDPASDPIPGLRRDVLFASTADEEAGGHAGAGWIVEHRPEWLRADGALNECGGVSVTVGGRRLYPIGVAEKGYAVYRITVHGTWGHGSMPRPDNAAVRAAAIVTRLAEPWAPRVTPVMERFLRTAADATDGPTAELLRGLAAGDPEADAALDRACDLSLARAGRALLRDTISTGIIAAGVKYNVIPGVAEIQIDCRTLPGTTEADLRERIRARLGDELAAACEIEPFLIAPAVEAPADGELYRIMETTLVDHDPEAVPVPAMAPFATDAKHTMKLGVPTYGFSPLRLDPAERFLERFHGTDERVSLEALRFGLPVLYDVVRRYCG